ncbi:MAG TPA: hypothetical protein VEK15_20080 [Vicinamibacteria bacterium]|nr:hypothetical protein [Vicinamibacteria bacterium]
MSSRLPWAAAVALAVTAYAVSLGGFYIPHIGDEAPYIEITRLTAESGRWLPLRTPPGLENTKPPLLFWLGIASSNWGRDWTLLRLRFPIVIVTFLTALIVGWLTLRLRSEPKHAVISALTFLGFYSSFQYGRPFLTNLPETLGAFSSFALVAFRGDRESVLPWISSGLALAMACLFKSFALVAPVGLALAVCLLMEGRLRHDFGRLLLVVGIGLGGFALWPLLDPDPAAVVNHFVVGENLQKLSSGDYWTGLFQGPYALHLFWLGPFANAGLFALPVAAMLFDCFRNRARISFEERALLVFFLAFLSVYTIPGQRQGNYLIPTTPALAILVGRRWLNFPLNWYRWFSLPGLALAAFLLPLVLAIDRDLLPEEGGYGFWHIAFLVLLVALWAASFLMPALARQGFHALVFLTFVSIAVGLAPFEGPRGRFDPARVQLMKRRTVFVPSEFVSRHERHRFLLPGARVRGYDPADADAVSRLLERGRLVVVHRPVGTEVEGPYRVVARRFDLNSRQSLREIARIVFEHDLDLLVREELILRRYRVPRLIKQ